jgi:glycosyltransferase involved in cell wall biosynthesis
MTMHGALLPRISICILSYNYGRYLRRAIDSSVQQEPGGYELEEILVVDGGSTDGSLDICAVYGEHVRVFARPRVPFATTLTDCIEQSRGDWVALLDADDWFAPEKLSVVAPHLHGGTLLIQHWEYVTDGDEVLLVPGPHPGGSTSTLVVNRRAALDLLPVSNELFFHVLADVGRGVQLTDPLTYYRVHQASMTDRKTPGVRQEYLAGVCVALAGRIDGLAVASPAWATESALRRLVHHYRAEARAHEVEAALQRGRRARALRPLCAALAHTVRAGRGYRRRWHALRSVVAGRALVRLRQADSAGA